MPTLHASPQMTPGWAHVTTTTSTAPAPTATTTTTRPAPTTVTAVTPAPTSTTTATTEAPAPTTTTVPAAAADVVLQRNPAVSDVVLLPATVAETAPPPPALPVTGAHTADLLTVSVALIVVGALAIITARRTNKKATTR